ncbi:alpha,alpha-trehalose-phosphate synthase (UDP-forming) [Labedella populi]|uniref:Trehalose-6-phosphate synthase n=1 Tax=Labedella populi TaxID=2498850 RepID=A0A444QAM8_9MICO|nr:alpha,alpha-trehalose-phosphate synthase (UDP-forming) [Labedella populi]RWZ61095.1 alpha,alpha-trehalose-phosphate synthase (UDP-forming) [Labedella populi]
MTLEAESYDFVVVANRLPVDSVTEPDGSQGWKLSPGGLVTALEPVMRSADGAWIGWPGAADTHIDPFEHDGITMVPVALDETEVERYYEGFSNDTLWPLYHDVIAQPSYHREWWDSYVTVNRRFADRAAALASHGGVVWVHDYQLQLVPGMLREKRPDLTIGFFNHIPFPAYGLYSQLPWRRQILSGLLGADVIGFQRTADAGNFQRAVRRLFGYETRGSSIRVPLEDTSERRPEKSRTVVARAFPISIDSASFAELAQNPDVIERARQIREDLGNPKTILFGVDRLDYTKGIRHRLKAFAELLQDGRLDAEETTLIQVASPSRERVAAYMELRDEIEMTVGRINGDYGSIGRAPVHYLHHGYPRDEMVALYLAADVMLVTALRDGMNLVAKEYVASRIDGDGVLILSEFAGASDDLRQALLINPHDIQGVKEAIMTAVDMEPRERKRRMRALRRRVLENDVAKWSQTFLDELSRASHASGGAPVPGGADAEDAREDRE